MWTRSLLKANARQVLSRCYWHIFLAGLIASVLTGGLTSGFSYTLRIEDFDVPPWMHSQQFTSLLATGSILVVCWAVFVAAPIHVGYCRFTMETRVGHSPLSTLFSVFQNGYWNTVRVKFLTDLSIVLWSFVLVVPGIIKSYEYYFVPYLLAENPNMTTARAKELSRLMTEGEKWNIFVLELSFIGWELLGMLIVIGDIFVQPYRSATKAELYAAMRAKAFSLGYSDANELGDFIRY